MSTWIYRIALNVAISSFRKTSRRRNVSHQVKDAIEVADPDVFPPENRDEIQRLHRMIGQLRELDRAIMLLYLDQKTYGEMAEILGLSASNIGTRISRIKSKLKAKFKQELDHE